MAVADDYGATVNEWVSIVRRARMHPTTKLVALLVASYADPDGTNIYPGVAKLAVQSRQSYRTVQRELQLLRKAGLVAVTKRQGERRGWRAGYQLTIAPGLLQRLDVLTPDQETAEAEAVAEQNRVRYRRYYARHAATKRHPDGVSSGDQTPSADTDQTPRPSRLAAETQPLPSLLPLPLINPPKERAQTVGEPTGGRQPAAAALNGFDVSTRAGTSRALRAQADALTAWIAEHPEAAS
jgi:DNA-binding transcriptional ArsR family regulator